MAVHECERGREIQPLGMPLTLGGHFLPDHFSLVSVPPVSTVSVSATEGKHIIKEHSDFHPHRSGSPVPSQQFGRKEV